MVAELFYPEPKEKKENLYDFEESLKRIIDGLKNPLVKMIVIKGLRRTGKSSLLRVALNECGYGYVLIDMREFDDISPKAFRRELTRALREVLSGKVKVVLDRIKAVSVLGIRLDIKSKKTTYRQLFRKINEIAMNKNTYLILAIDEAQEVARFGFDKYLAFAYDNLKAIKLILTGSQIGLLSEVLDNPDAPLFGRPRLEIDIEKLSRERGKEFLEQGFAKYNVIISEIWIQKALDIFDGIIGWLNLFGWHIVNLGNPEEALQKTLQDAKKLAKKELEKFLKTRGIAYDRYVYVIKILASGPRKWKEIKTLLEMKLKRNIPNNKISRYLNELRKYGFITKENNKYKIPDPLISKVILEDF